MTHQYVNLPSGSVKVNDLDFFESFTMDQLQELKSLVEIKIIANEKMKKSYAKELQEIVEKSNKINQMLVEYDSRLAKKKELLDTPIRELSATSEDVAELQH